MERNQLLTTLAQFGVSYITTILVYGEKIMATDSNRFPLQNSIRKILDDPNSRPKLPGLDEGSVVGDDKFGEADDYGTGKWSDIALNNGKVVVGVHNTEDSKSLYYRVGKVDGGKIDWADESHDYDNGVNPSVAINDDGLVVEVHKSQGASNALWYRVGNVEGNEIKWRNNDTSAEYSRGVNPSVAITNSGLVVEVHQSQSHDTLWYSVGKVEGDIINWKNNRESYKFAIPIEYDRGVNPSVAITNSGLVVEAHCDGLLPSSTLLCRLGNVEDNIINWRNTDKDKRRYAYGTYPSVAITNDGLVVEVSSYDSLNEPGHPTLRHHRGQVKGDTIDWGLGGLDKLGIEYNKGGSIPRVACNERLAVETHSGADNQLLSSVLTLPAFLGKWIALEGDNSYCYCACNSATDNKDRHVSSHTMNVKAGAPYFYAFLTKDDGSIDFPTGAVLTIEGPDGTKYDRDIEEENQLVIMSSSSVACLIVKDPKPGDWKMKMTVPEGVGFHCQCNTVPSKDVYNTMTDTLNSSEAKKSLQDVSFEKPFIGPVMVFHLHSKRGDPANFNFGSFLFEGVGELEFPGIDNQLADFVFEGMEVPESARVVAESSRTAAQRQQPNVQTVVRFATWNMRGAVNVPWLTQLVEAAPSRHQQQVFPVLALQETGDLPSAGVSNNNGFFPAFGGIQPLIDPNTGATIGNILLKVLQGYIMEFLYWENTWAQGGLAVASNLPAQAHGVLNAVNPVNVIPRNTRNLPWMTINIPFNNQVIPLTIYTMHAPPPTPDHVAAPPTGRITDNHVRQWVTAQINQITQREGNNNWILLGDFNIEPAQLGNIPGVRIVHSNRTTHESGRTLDYAVTNVQGIEHVELLTMVSASDHYPVAFEWHLNTN
jgi:hypothetical protein